MAQTINTNIASLNAQRNLNTSQTALATSLQRLSSGLRINSAKDDAAGLAISERFTTQIRGLNQAVRNANDGISLAQTGEGALGELTSNLQRIRELAVQSSNATNSTSDRAALDLEVQQRLAEIDRTANQTSFNGRKILDGSFGDAAFQIGANVGETINVALGSGTSMRQGAIGAVATTTSADLTSVISPATGGSYVSGTIASFNFATVPATPTVSAASGAYTQAASDNAADAFQITIGGAVASDNLVGDADATKVQADLVAFVGASSGAYSLSGTVGGGDLKITKADGTALVIGATFSNAVGSSTVAAGTTSGGTFATGTFVGTTAAAGAADTSANKVITVDGGANITLTSSTEAGAVSQLQTALNTQAANTYTVSSNSGKISIAKIATGTAAPVIAGTDAATFTTGGTPTAGAAAQTITVADDFSIKVGDTSYTVANGTYDTAQKLTDAINTALGGNAYVNLATDATSGATTISVSAGEAITISTSPAALGFGSTEIAASGSLETANVLSVANSNTTIQRIDSALSSVSTLRSTFGAIQNRFESVISSLSATSENASAARSRIQDADFAAETAQLTRNQILQQAGIAMLSQANSLPQNVLSLLR